MKRLIIIFVLLLSASVCQAATSYACTTDVLYIEYGATIVEGSTTAGLNYSVTANMGTNRFDLTGMYARWIWYDTYGAEAKRYGTTIADPTNGTVTATVLPSTSFNGSSRMKVYNTSDSNYVATLSKDFVVITSSSTPAGGCGDTYVNVTNITLGGTTINTTLVSVATTIVQTNVISMGDTIVNPTTTVSVTSGDTTIQQTNNISVTVNPTSTVNIASGVTSVQGTNGVITFVSTNGTVSFEVLPNGNINLSTVGYPSQVFPSYLTMSNYVALNYTGSTQLWQVPSGISNVQVWVLGAGGGLISYNSWVSCGGLAIAQIPVIPLETLFVIVGQGGYVTTGNYVFTDSAFGGGGRGMSRGTGMGGGGGGFSGIARDTNFLVIAGGGAGGCSALNIAGYPQHGGGYDGFYPQSTVLVAMGAYGGSQTNGGPPAPMAGTKTTVMLYTNTAGSYLKGGDAGCGTNAGVSTGVSGGGGGYFGGGGGFGAETACFGGGGSGRISGRDGVVGFFMQPAQQAAGHTHLNPYNIPGYTYSLGNGAGNAHNARGNHGLVIIRY